jgi:hypothetical protein
LLRTIPLNDIAISGLLTREIASNSQEDFVLIGTIDQCKSVQPNKISNSLLERYISAAPNQVKLQQRYFTFSTTVHYDS